VVILTGRVSRIGRIALPFVLLFVGAAAFYVSPWPAIIRAALGGAHIHVYLRWETVGLLAIAVLCWAAAIWLSLQVKRD
jgi:hypothetical protein